MRRRSSLPTAFYLATQAVLVFMGSAAMLGVVLHMARVEIPRIGHVVHSAVELRRALHAAGDAVYAAQVSDGGSWEDASRQVSAARAALAATGDTIPLADRIQVSASLDMMSGPGPDSEELRAAAARMGTILDAVEEGLAARVSRMVVTFGRRTGGIWLATLGGWLLTGVLGRRAYQRDVVAAREATNRALAGLAEALEVLGEGGELPELPDLPALDPLTRQVRLLAGEFGRLREASAHERRVTGFLRDAMRALELADGESEALDVAARAVTLAAPGCEAQIWMADNSHAELLPALDGGPEHCDPGSPWRCPAIRRGATERHGTEPSLARCPRLAPGRGPVTCIEVGVNGRAVGTIQVAGEELGGECIEAIEGLAGALGTRLTVLRTLGERELQASTDVLTGLANRRQMNALLARLDRAGEPYGIVAADLDHFKRLNDTYGHEVGDRCLKVFAQALRDACRKDDVPCRPGGEEFTVVLPGACLEDATEVAERIRERLATASRQSGPAFTVSLGVAARPANGDEAEAVLQAADAALYRAKEAGRDRVCAAGSPAALAAAS